MSAKPEGGRIEWARLAPKKSKDGKRFLRPQVELIIVGEFCRVGCDRCGAVKRLVRDNFHHFEMVKSIACRGSHRTGKRWTLCRSCEFKMMWLEKRFTDSIECQLIIRKLEKEKPNVTT